MQRKNSGSYFTRQQSALFHNSKNNSPFKKLSVSTQTENVPNFSEKHRLCNLSSMSIEEIRENYISALNFLNYCHDFMNKIFEESTSMFGDIKFGKIFGFRVPEVPNYFSVLDMFLEKSGAPIAGQIWNKKENFKGTKRNNSENEVSDKEIGEEQDIFDLQQFLPKNIGDGPGPGPGSVRSSRGPRNSGMENVTNQTMFKDKENFKMDCGIKNVGVRKRPSTSPSRLVKSEKDIPKRSSRHDLKVFSTTFEEILKTCNEFEHKSKEHLCQKETPLETYQNPREKGDIVESFQQGGQKNQRNKQEVSMDDHIQSLQQETRSRDHTPELTKSNGIDSFNLMEYALKNLRDSEYDSSSPSLSPRSGAGAPTDNVNMISNQKLLTKNMSNRLLTFKGMSLKEKKSLPVLNEAYQSPSPKKVNEMFKKISKEELGSTDGLRSSCDFNDSATFIKFMDNDNFSDEFGREYASKVFIENCDQNEKGRDNVRITSSSDSVILTDEEFDKKNQNSFLLWTKDKVNVNKDQQYRSEKNKGNGSLAREMNHKPIKSHPFKLTDKDRSQADQKILQAIGLFTERGDIRPGMISILEEKQRMSLTQNAMKNVQFRTQRKFDVQVHYNINDSTKKAQKQASKESLSRKSLANQQIGSNASLHSSAVTFSSSSTVSDSDLLSMEPNSDQTVIKKF